MECWNPGSRGRFRRHLCESGCWPSMPALQRPLSLCSVGGRKIINHFVAKVAFCEIGASICHDFVTRNLKYRDQHNHSWTLNRPLVKQRVNFDTLRGESIHPKSSPPSVLIGSPVPDSPGFPLKTCGNNGLRGVQ